MMTENIIPDPGVEKPYDHLLGTMPDTVIAEMEGIPYAEVRKRRLAMGIQRNTTGRPTAFDAELGSMPDAALAIKHGLPYAKVRHRRISLGIQAYSKEMEVPTSGASYDHLLGTMSDVSIARLFSVPAQEVRTKRYAAGIRRYLVSDLTLIPRTRKPRTHKPRPWDEHLGMKPDQEIADEVGITRSAVALRRKNLGIPPFSLSKRPSVEQYAVMDSLLGTKKNMCEIAKIVGCSIYFVSKRRKETKTEPSPPDFNSVLHLIGTVPDAEISTLLNCPISTIRKFRLKKLGRRFRKKPITDENIWQAIDPLLGTVPDTKIQRDFGIPVARIAHRRKKLGIKSFFNLDYEALDNLLGTVSDREAAEIIGCSHCTVYTRRHLLGIPACNSKKLKSFE